MQKRSGLRFLGKRVNTSHINKWIRPREKNDGMDNLIRRNLECNTGILYVMKFVCRRQCASGFTFFETCCFKFVLLLQLAVYKALLLFLKMKAFVVDSFNPPKKSFYAGDCNSLSLSRTSAECLATWLSTSVKTHLKFASGSIMYV